MTEHVAVMAPVRSRAEPNRVDVAVRCGCGVRALLIVRPCETPKCNGRTHVSGGGVWRIKKAKREALECPALVAVARYLDPSMPKGEANRIAREGPVP